MVSPESHFSSAARSLPLATMQFVAVFCTALGLGCSGSTSTLKLVVNEAGNQVWDLSSAEYVGQERCVDCHKQEFSTWQNSHHDLAMQPATDSTVLGDFNDAKLEHFGITSRMYRDGDRFLVETEGESGAMQVFEVSYVFGVEPLQQYMVEFPSGEGESEHNGDGAIPRVQVLRLCWDTAASKWFYLSPPDVKEKLDPHDELHWTGTAQRWNSMCADCHSTGYQKHFSPPQFSTIAQREDPTSTGSYRDTFIDIDVTCEACHGPGSVHIELAQQWFPGWNRERGFGLADLKGSAESQIQACAPCHSRRDILHPGFVAGNNFYDHYSNAQLIDPVYYADGQILDEDYVHGSFIQSKMYHKGIRCSDCHDPHSARLKHNGNEVCTSCHQHPAAKYDSVGHHFHKMGSEGAACVNCHMPATTYMDVDSRRDHSLRIPRPDLSIKIGTPNACTGCHLEVQNVASEKRDSLKLYQDWMQAARDGDDEVLREIERVNQWCDDACEKWYGENRRRDVHFGEALAAARKRDPSARQKLLELLAKRGAEAPAIARATALTMLLDVDLAAAGEMATKLIEDDHPLVRAAACTATVGIENQGLAGSLLEGALRDPIRAVRLEAARQLLQYDPQLLSSASTASLRSALGELTTGLEYSSDRSGANLALGILAEQQGRDQQAIKYYERAIAVEPRVAGPRTNLAALMERSVTAQSSDGYRAEIEELRREELALLQRDAELLPDNAALQHRLGLAQYLAGNLDEAIESLTKAAELQPENAAFAQIVALLMEKLGRVDDAISWARKAVACDPDNQENQRLLQHLQQL